MSKILVIADDLTGAAEIAGLAYNFGLSVSVRLMDGIDDDFEEDVLVVNTDTRNLDRGRVIIQIEKVLRCFKLDHNLLVFKKTDSLLRGWIETEIMPIISNTTNSFALLIPANPSRNRLIRNGKYYINGLSISETEFSLDPEYPRNHSEVLALIQDRSEKTVAGKIDYNDTKGKIVIPDATSVEDIRAIINTRICSETLLTGAADFFRELLPYWFKQITERTPPYLMYPIHKVFIIGSRDAANKNAINSLNALGFQFHPLTRQMLNEEEKFEDWKSEIIMQLGSSKGCILACPEERIKDSSKIDHITERLVEIGVELANSDKPPTHFFITGGKTASLFCNRLAWNCLSIQSGSEDGIVTLSVKNSKHLLTIKPGSYSWPDDLIKSEQ